MKTLAIESSTEACSVALFDGPDIIDSAFAVIGRGHAERLVPMIAALPGKGRAERIVVSLGPGSFTGVRIGLAAARALGLAWGAEVLGYPSLALVAATVRQQRPDAGLTVCMTGGHGEWLVQDFAADGMPAGDLASLRPQAAAARGALSLIAGSKASELAALLPPAGEAVDLLPDARYIAAMPAVLFVADLAPVYGRPPDARLPGSQGTG